MSLTTAQQIAAQFNNDGQNFTDAAGAFLLTVLREACLSTGTKGSTERFEFADESALLVSGDVWDLESDNVFYRMKCEE